MAQREIKFRAWDKTSETFVNDYAHIGMYGELYTAQFHSSAYSANGSPNLILLQYTGLKDVNDKEIYEDDIIHCVHDWGDDFYEPHGKDEFEVRVAFDSGQFVCFDDKKGKDSEYNLMPLFVAVESMDAEIIGNIYIEPIRE